MRRVLMKTSIPVKDIEEKFAGLSDTARQEVLDFLDFISIRESRREKGSEASEDASFWQMAEAGSLERIWNNTEDDVYAKLLDS
jgi:hypothetical protein